MNNFMYTVINADVPVKHVGESIQIYANFVITRAVVTGPNAHIVVSALISVQCVMQRSDIRAICQVIEEYIVVTAFIPVHRVIRHLLQRAIS
jgi:NDP-sugar pyrophosphorylase family protein